MNCQTDQQLLRDYAEHGVEAAFAELVRGHIDFVYSAALRMVCDAHFAEDVTQGVFVALAQNARQLADRPDLSGWLHCTARNLGAKTVRSEERRRAREQEAAAMNDLLSSEPDILWEHISPHLDAAIGELSDPDRDAVLLRYFKRKSAHEMAQALGISEDAAQKRVSRAVERLRESFAKHGVSVGASGLVVAISANAVQAAPGGLAITISTAAALARTTLATTPTAATIKTIAMTALQKTLISVTIAAALGTGIYEARQASALRSQNLLLQQQQGPLVEQIEQLQHQRDDASNRLVSLADEIAQAKSNSTELLRLRGEVGRLRIQEREIGGVRRDQMRAAQITLPYAKAEFERLKALPAGAVSTQQLAQAGFAAELLEAEAEGDASKAAQVRLRQAEEELELLTEPYGQQLVSETEYNKARYAVDVARAELRGDDVEAGQIKLRQAEEELTRAAELRSQSLISETEYNEAVRRVELLRGGLKP